MLSKKHILVIVSLTILTNNLSVVADWKNDARAIDISGGENHTLVLTSNKATWACGPNGKGYPYYYYGVLGTGSNSYTLVEKTLVRVLDGDMSTTSGYLQDIEDIDAGWKHSLALDVNGCVWSWGGNNFGQLGDGSRHARTTPVHVHRGEQPDGLFDDGLQADAVCPEALASAEWKRTDSRGY